MNCPSEDAVPWGQIAAMSTVIGEIARAGARFATQFLSHRAEASFKHQDVWSFFTSPKTMREGMQNKKRNWT